MLADAAPCRPHKLYTSKNITLVLKHLIDPDELNSSYTAGEASIEWCELDVCVTKKLIIEYSQILIYLKVYRL